MFIGLNFVVGAFVVFAAVDDAVVGAGVVLFNVLQFYNPNELNFTFGFV